MSLQLTYNLRLPKGFVDPMSVSFLGDVQFWTYMLPAIFVATCVLAGTGYLVIRFFAKKVK